MLAAEPLVIMHAEISRPKAKGDITLKADVRSVARSRCASSCARPNPAPTTFNNVPRYDLAAYELQKLFLDPPEYVVPPTALRMVPLADFANYSPGVAADVPGGRPGARRRAVLAAATSRSSRTSTIPRVSTPIPCTRGTSASSTS